MPEIQNEKKENLIKNLSPLFICSRIFWLFYQHLNVQEIVVDFHKTINLNTQQKGFM